MPVVPDCGALTLLSLYSHEYSHWFIEYLYKHMSIHVNKAFTVYPTVNHTFVL